MVGQHLMATLLCHSLVYGYAVLWLSKNKLSLSLCCAVADPDRDVWILWS